MENHFDLNTFKTYYSSLLEHICSNKDFLETCHNVSNIWKTTDHTFLRFLSSFFSKQPEQVKMLIPSSKLYSAVVSFCEKNNDQEFLNWVTTFNNTFLYSVAKASQKKRTTLDDHPSFNFHENMRKCENGYKYLESLVVKLQEDLKMAQEKNALLTLTIENIANEECEQFRKRMKTKISSINQDQTTTI